MLVKAGFPPNEREIHMNTIATTYRHAPAHSPNAAASGLWGSFRAVLTRLASPTAAAAGAARDPVREAASVRAMADAIRNSDPHFAADLYAAADRHEELYGGAGLR